MIFVTIGTSEPFDRLLRSVERFSPGEEVVVQCGDSTIRPAGATCVDYLSFDEFVGYLRSARAVIMHAGAGSILTAIASGKRPIVVPRLPRFGEAVDDHQLTFARRLHDEGVIVLVEDLSTLAKAVAGAVNGNRLRQAEAPLVHELRDVLRTLLADGDDGAASAS
jgi:UDP-N-acetylglucosamine transferase subunit ALG13